MSTFEARYHGTCGACDGRIIPGENVRYSGDDYLVHSRCEESELTERKVEADEAL